MSLTMQHSLDRVIVDKFKYLKDQQTTSAWSAFQRLIVCPNCGDDKGHAGTMPSEDDTDIPRFGRCVKCDTNIILKTEGFKNQYIIPKKVKNHWEADYATLNLTAMDKTLEDVRVGIQASIKDARKKTEKALQLRGYPKDYVSWLIDEKDVGWYAPNFDGINIVGGYPKAPMLQYNPISSPTSKMKVWEMRYRPMLGMEGLLIPVYRDGKKIGLTIRREGPVEGLFKHRYMGFKTVNTLKHTRAENPNKDMVDEYDKYLPPATFYPTNLQQDKTKHRYTLEAPGSCLFITEGEMKANGISYFFNEAVVGVRGISNYTNEEVKRYILDNRHKTVIIASDRDYKTNEAVGLNVYQLAAFCSSLDLNAYFLTWKHPNKKLDATLKGVDDAILLDYKTGGIVWGRMSAQEFFANLQHGAVQKIAGTVIKPGQIYTEAQIDQMHFVEKDTTSFNIQPDVVYKKDVGPELYAKLIANSKLIVDISPTGTGKSHRAGKVELASFKAAWLEEVEKKHPAYLMRNQLTFDYVEPTKVPKELEKQLTHDKPQRFKMLELSPMNNTVKTLVDKKWKVTRGRNSKGWTFDPKTKKFRHAHDGDMVLIPGNCPQSEDIIKLRENRQVLEIRKDICMKCPFMKDCAYLSDKKVTKDSTYARMNMASFQAREGDVVFCDDWGSLSPFIDVKITRSDVQTLYSLLRHNPKWANPVSDIVVFCEKILARTKAGLTGRDILNEIDAEGGQDIYPINEWLRLPEPDAVSKRFIKVRENGISVEDDSTMSIQNIKRFFFMFLEVFSGKSFGDIYYQYAADGEEDTWVIKGVDPKFKDTISKVSGFIIFDATADIEGLTRVFGEKPLIVSAEADPFSNIEVCVVKGFSPSYKSVIKKEKGRTNLMGQFNWAVTYQKEHPDEKVGVITYKSLVEDDSIRSLFDPDTTFGYWWNDDRATNTFYDAGVTTLICIGVPIPNLSATAAEVEKGNGDIRTVYVARPYGPRKEDGTRDFIICKDTEDPILRHALWYKRSATMIQTAGRLRSIQQPDKQFKLIMMDNVPLPFEVDTMIEVSEKDKQDNQRVVSNIEHLKAKKIAYLGAQVEMFEQAIKDGHTGLSENARQYLLRYGYHFDFMYRYTPKLAKFFTFEDMIRVLKERQEEIRISPDNLIPMILQEARMEYIDSPELSNDGVNYKDILLNV